MRNPKKNIKKFKKQYFVCQPGPECGYFAKTSLFVFSGVHGLAISNAIASLLLHKNEPNKIDSERTRRDEEAGPNPILLAEFV
jgi:hypothetical protein